ncbi:unnamed protein product [Bursaphelenchus okinawaensis]|uniref:Palmitoyltransferase n=1 Tax=Bursaphelenchus okinawaensis TaxID=465554 RepID=A0A811KI52_9BILA|nr:unnamed protein product [Bursaphelenchus okinawaensis]CAG9105096.1 unnamed protein product [Bursaphelenchus okinawaensis]
MASAILHSPICRFILKVGRAVPVVVILIIVSLSYYVYVFQTVPLLTSSWYLRVPLYIAFHILLCLFLLSYFMTVMAPLPEIPAKYYLTRDALMDFWAEKSEVGRNDVLFRYISQNSISTLNVSPSEGPRFCGQCKCIKPDRSHHCSICSRCVLRYDHHCPWVNNCVHNNNYKFFLLFLFYGVVLCLYVLCTSLSTFISFWKGKPVPQDMISNFGSLFLPFLAFLFGLSMSCLLFYHIYLVCRNKTTVEQWNPPHFDYGPDPGAYNLGSYRNFKQIFGDKPLLWLLPVHSTVYDGLGFPHRAQTSTTTSTSQSYRPLPSETLGHPMV